ncbi:hypothetical protein [Nocardia spumae]|uniref:hypothetical protein n=1 Tax=Nocardia spumae TaxID=2887190 RepID=UPI001D145D2A|nr:hypothetical protein [Nocardia spumae]
MSRQRRGIAPTVVVFAALGAGFLCLVAYCAFGWGGVIALALLAAGGGAVAHSEAGRIARDRQRYDNDYVYYHAAYSPAPQRARRKGTR